MPNMNKRGISQILQVATLLVLSIAAISLVWGYVADLTGDFEDRLSPAVDCLSQTSRLVSACINSQGQIEATLLIAPEEDIDSASFAVGQESFVCNSNSCSTCSLMEGSHVVYLETLSAVAPQTEISMRFNNCPNLITANIVPC